MRHCVQTKAEKAKQTNSSRCRRKKESGGGVAKGGVKGGRVVTVGHVESGNSPAKRAYPPVSPCSWGKDPFAPSSTAPGIEFKRLR